MDIPTTIDSLEEVWESVDQKVERLITQVVQLKDELSAEQERVIELEGENGELEVEVARLRADLEQLKYETISNKFVKSLTAGYEK